MHPPADLLDRYFSRPPGEEVGVLAGAVIDEAPPADGTATAAERYAWLKSSMSQEVTLAHGEYAFAQTANCAVRRVALERAGGFEPGVRSGGDADMCFRVRAAGWALERREEAAVTHRNRATIPRMLAQRARHGAGAAWLSRRWPGALPRRSWPGLAWWSARRAAAGSLAAARGDRDGALLGLLDGPAVWAFELGRLIPTGRVRGWVRSVGASSAAARATSRRGGEAPAGRRGGAASFSGGRGRGAGAALARLRASRIAARPRRRRARARGRGLDEVAVGAVQLELAAGERRDVGGQAARVAAVADERVGGADERLAAGREAKPEVPVLGEPDGRLEPAGPFERAAAHDDARRGDRVRGVEQRLERRPFVATGLEVGPALAGRPAVRAYHERAAEAQRGVRLLVEGGELRGELALGPGVVGVAQRDEVDLRRRALRSPVARAAAGPPQRSRRRSVQRRAWSGCRRTGSGDASSTTTISAGAGRWLRRQSSVSAR